MDHFEKQVDHYVNLYGKKNKKLIEEALAWIIELNRRTNANINLDEFIEGTIDYHGK
jgi:hypothetical protein